MSRDKARRRRAVIPAPASASAPRAGPAPRGWRRRLCRRSRTAIPAAGARRHRRPRCRRGRWTRPGGSDHLVFLHWWPQTCGQVDADAVFERACEMRQQRLPACRVVLVHAPQVLGEVPVQHEGGQRGLGQGAALPVADLLGLEQRAGVGTTGLPPACRRVGGDHRALDREWRKPSEPMRQGWSIL